MSTLPDASPQHPVTEHVLVGDAITGLVICDTCHLVLLPSGVDAHVAGLKSPEPDVVRVLDPRESQIVPGE